jgi:hypothetical protein
VGQDGQLDELGDLVVGDAGEQRVGGDVRVAVPAGGVGREASAAVGGLPVGEDDAGAGEHGFGAAGGGAPAGWGVLGE